MLPKIYDCENGAYPGTAVTDGKNALRTEAGDGTGNTGAVGAGGGNGAGATGKGVGERGAGNGQNAHDGSGCIVAQKMAMP